jgi:ribose-phosphate pyrophosphokinase
MERVLIDLDQSIWGEYISTTFEIPFIKFRKRYFPDGESYFRVLDEVSNKEVVVICTLNNPNAKLLDLVFISKTLKENGALRIGLIAPYLPYMRQDIQFNPGEGINARYFASVISAHFNWLITVDPHLHRISTLENIFSISTRVLKSYQYIADWIRENVQNPLILGPDSESKQWVEKVAFETHSPYEVLEKIRMGDREVEEMLPDLSSYKDHTPVIIDDIISSGETMTRAVHNLARLGLAPPVCIGIHGIFADDAYSTLVNSGAREVVTCNTIKHPSNKIDVTQGLTKLL